MEYVSLLGPYCLCTSDYSPIVHAQSLFVATMPSRKKPAPKSSNNTVKAAPCLKSACTSNRNSLKRRDALVKDYTLRMRKIGNLLMAYGGVDGAHHKQWLLDQVLREATYDNEGYKRWTRRFRGNYDEDEGEYEYAEWDTGIPC